MTNLVITGPARSGTTLTCHLLNKLPDTVALHEPLDFAAFAGMSPPEMADEVERFYGRMRGSLLAEGRAVARHVDGRIPADVVAGEAGGGDFSLRRFLRHLPRRLSGQRRLRRNRGEHGTIRVDKRLSPDFLLAIKEPAGFSALLPELAGRMRCVAVVRNPLATLGSWNSIEFPPGLGRATVAERVDPSLAAALDAIADRYERQLFLLDWWYSRLQEWVPPREVIRYEAIMASGGRALETITPRAATLDEPLENRNANPLYDHVLMRRLGKRLLASEGAYWHFYERDDVETLLAELDDE